MLRIRKVLFPTDFSSCSHQALLHAVRIAQDHGAELHVMHAVVFSEDDPHDPAHHVPDPARIRALLEELAEERMGALLKEGLLPDLVLKLVQRRDMSAAPPIVQYAEEAHIDLIVMGTHGRRGFRKWLLGSVTNEVVRFAPCSVLAVRGEGEPAPVDPIRKILLPVDFSQHGKEALEVACSLASTYGAHLELIHVLPDGLHPTFYTMGGTKLSEVQPGIMEKAETAMAELLQEAPVCEGVSRSTNAVEGHPGREIVRFSRNHEVDLIVIATHGLSGLEHLLLGSTTEKVMAGAECPVFVTKVTGKSLLS
ncbi:MAG: universal stress protein [Gemmatimonadota bacterium]|jgi:nucleotide-binding universal stress UspA family protein